MLGRAIELVHRLVDLGEPGRLFGRGIGDRRNLVGDIAHGGEDTVEGPAGVADQLHPLLHLVAAGTDQLGDLLGGLGGALREGADLGGDDGEAAPGLARAGRLDARVQGQQVGLEGNLVDHAGDLLDPL